jgi:hypothetical protein
MGMGRCEHTVSFKQQVNTFTLDRLAKALGVDASELIESVPDED